MTSETDAELQKMRDAAAAGKIAKAADPGEIMKGDLRLREEQWRALGYEPTPNRDGSLSSPSTLRSLGRWPPPGAKKLAANGQAPPSEEDR